jgi:hypothetical protein
LQIPKESNMKILRTTNVLAGLMALTLLTAAPAATAQTNAELLKRVQQLEEQVRMLLDAKQVASINSAQVTTTPVAITEKRKPTEKPPGLGFEVGSTWVGYGGYIKLDAIFSEYSGGDSAISHLGEDFLVASTIPVGGESSGLKFHASAKASRFYFTTFTPTKAGHINTRFEMDYFGSVQGNEVISNSYASRLRHAYVNWRIDDVNAVLGGQSWSTFQNTAVLPDTLDFIGTVGTIFNRQAQLRYTRAFEKGNAQFSMENPSSTLYSGVDIMGGAFDDNSIPDLIARYNGSRGSFSYSLAGIFREIAIHTDEMDESRFGGAISFASKYKFGNDDIRIMLSGGNALGRYLGVGAFRDAQIELDKTISLIPQYGGFIAYRHPWSAKLRSSIVASAIAADNPGSADVTTPRAYQSLHVNLIYEPLPKLSFGGEYIWARRQDEGIHGTMPDDEGSLNRFQASLKYNF